MRTDKQRSTEGHRVNKVLLVIAFVLVIAIVSLFGVYRAGLIGPQQSVPKTSEEIKIPEATTTSKEVEAVKEEIKADIAKKVPNEVKTEVAAIIPEETFIVDSESWKTAMIPTRKTDGARMSGVVFNVSKGTVIYAPFDGSLAISYIKSSDGVTYKSFAFGPHTGSWLSSKDVACIQIICADPILVEGVEVGKTVKRGAPLLSVGSEEVVFGGFINERADLVIKVFDVWHEKIKDQTVALAYLEKMVSLC
ncbi:MAG: hypothetical protein PHG66_02360 [Candidatus Colwellbacteria bacterium]|nr:hypothetical protein [Candidatus Colwellbacteria bacterium]